MDYLYAGRLAMRCPVDVLIRINPTRNDGIEGVQVVPDFPLLAPVTE